MVQKSSKERQHEFDVAYMNMAIAMSNLSYAIKKQVGCIVVSKDDQVISQGFNGMPIGMPNICEEIYNINTGEHTTLETAESYHDKKKQEEILVQYRNINKGMMPGFRLITKDITLHAESNAITKLAKYNSSAKGGTVYVTLSPCIHCAKLLVQSEVSRVVYLNNYKSDAGIKLLEVCGIIVDKLNMD